jgi:hypothetical protein
MRDEVEQPVTDDGEADDEPGARASEDRCRNPPRRDAPDHRHAQAVAPGIVHEGQRRERGVSRLDPDRLDTDEQKYRPEKIETERGGNQRRERRPRLGTARAQGNGEMANKHRIGFCHNVARRSGGRLMRTHVVTASALVFAALSYAPAASAAGSCEGLSTLKLPHTTFTLSDHGAGWWISTTESASFCRVAATLTPSSDSNIKMEVWLPGVWVERQAVERRQWRLGRFD